MSSVASPFVLSLLVRRPHGPLSPVIACESAASCSHREKEGRKQTLSGRRERGNKDQGKKKEKKKKGTESSKGGQDTQLGPEKMVAAPHKPVGGDERTSDGAQQGCRAKRARGIPCPAPPWSIYFLSSPSLTAPLFASSVGRVPVKKARRRALHWPMSLDLGPGRTGGVEQEIYLLYLTYLYMYKGTYAGAAAPSCTELSGTSYMMVSVQKHPRSHAAM